MWYLTVNGSENTSDGGVFEHLSNGNPTTMRFPNGGGTVTQSDGVIINYYLKSSTSQSPAIDFGRKIDGKFISYLKLRF